MMTVELALVCQLLLWLGVIGFFLASGQASIFHPLTFYLAFHGMVFVLRPWLVYAFDFDTIWAYMRFFPSEHDFKTTLAVTSLALLVFSIAVLVAGRAQLHFSTGEAAPFSQVEKRALVVTTALLLPLVLYSIHSFTHGGFQGENRGGTYVLTGASGYTIEAQFMAGPLICAWMAVTRFSFKAILFIFPYLAYRAWAGMDRWTIVLLALALCTVYAWQKRIRWVPLWSVVVAIPLYIMFQTMGANRAYFGQLFSGQLESKSEQPKTASEAIKAKYDSQEFANFDFLCFVVKMVPERTGTYTYASQYLQLFTEPIPRKLWPGKPAGAPVAFFNLNNYGNFLGLTVSLPGDGWVSGGWLGVILTSAIVGCLLGLAHRWYWRNVQNNIGVMIYCVGIAMLPQWYRDGGISIAKFLFWNLSPLIVWMGITWLLGPKLVPSYSVLLPRATRLRIRQSSQLRPEKGVGA